MTLSGTFSVCRGTGMLYTGAVQTDFESELNRLLSTGEALYAFSAADSRFAGVRTNKQLFSLSWHAVSGELRIICENYTPFPEYDVAGASLSPPLLIQVGFDYAPCLVPEGGSLLSKTACGQSQVLVLEDGAFVIIDGGAKFAVLENAPASAEALAEQATDRLYQLLQAYNRRKDRKIVIAAWILTHLHYDHCTVFERFARRYGSCVNLHAILYNYPWSGQMLTRSSGELPSDDPDAILQYLARQYFAGRPVVFIPRTGQRMAFGGWEMELLATVDDLYPAPLTRGNNASMVFRFLPSGNRTDRLPVLFLGDIEAEVSDRLAAWYGGYLATPILQAAHHGYRDGGSEALYRAIGAKHILWTNSALRWRLTGSTGVVPQWLTSAADGNPCIYPQCSQAELATDWELSFADENVTARMLSVSPSPPHLSEL